MSDENKVLNKQDTKRLAEKRIRKPAREILRLDLDIWRKNQKLPHWSWNFSK